MDSAWTELTSAYSSADSNSALHIPVLYGIFVCLMYWFLHKDVMTDKEFGVGKAEKFFQPSLK